MDAEEPLNVEEAAQEQQFHDYLAPEVDELESELGPTTSGE